MPGDLPKRRSTKTDHEHLWSKINDELILMMIVLIIDNSNSIVYKRYIYRYMLHAGL